MPKPIRHSKKFIRWIGGEYLIHCTIEKSPNWDDGHAHFSIVDTGCGESVRLFFDLQGGKNNKGRAFKVLAKFRKALDELHHHLTQAQAKVDEHSTLLKAEREENERQHRNAMRRARRARRNNA